MSPFSTPEEVLAHYREQRASQDGSVSDYEGYSPPTVKRAALRAVLSLTGRDLVDLGCGPNPVTAFEAAARGWRVSGVDLSEDFCRNARALAARRDVEIVLAVAPVDATPFDAASFDVALLTEVLEHVPDEAAVLREIVRILRPGGRLVITVPNAASLFQRYLAWRNGFTDENPEHLREYTLTSLRAVVSAAGLAPERALRIPATVEPPWQAKAAWLIDRLTLRPQWGLSVGLVARKQGGVGSSPRILDG